MTRAFECKTRDALDFGDAVLCDVGGGLGRANAFELMLAEIDVSHQFAHNLEIEYHAGA